MGQNIVNNIGLGILLFFLAFMVVWIIYPFILRIATKMNIYDKPDTRKLHIKPVPVLGGLSIFCGIAIGFIIVYYLFVSIEALLILVAMSALLAIGIFDDKKGLPVTLRFIIETGVVLGMILINGNLIDHFHGLFGLEEISPYVSYPLSIIAGVGIINAINLIDGIDGYSSGFIALACMLFAVVFFASRIFGLAIMCLICTGAILPFFLHNVFGKSTKMFIGDGGTLMLGTLMTAFVFSMLRKDSMCVALEEHNIGLVSVCYAILSVPVTDTVRVMITRIARGISPFHPDKTHLHHLFIDMGYSHLGTTLSLLCLNLMTIIGWLVAWTCGADVTVQFIVVISISILNTMVLYPFMRNQMEKNGKIHKIACTIGRRTQWNNTRTWAFIQKIVEGKA